MVKNAGFSEYMEWVSGGTVFFLRPHKSLLAEDGVRAGVDWDSVVRIDGMVKLLLEMYNVSYLPIESVSMQERVRAVQFVLDREIRSSEALKSSPLQNQHSKRMRESVEACAVKSSSNALSTGGNGLIIARELAATMLPTSS